METKSRLGAAFFGGLVFLLSGALTSLSLAGDGEAHIEVLVIKAAGKTAKKPAFDKRIEYLRGAFKALTYASFKLSASFRSGAKPGSVQSFKLGPKLRLEVTPESSEKGYRAKCTLWKVSQEKGKKEKLSKILSTTVNAKDGGSFVLGDLADFDGKGSSLLVVVKLQSKPFESKD